MWLDVWMVGGANDRLNVLTVMDDASRFVFTDLVPDRKAETLIRSFLRMVGLQFPVGELDGDNEFNNGQWTELCQALGIKQWFTPPHSATGRGGIERMHRELNRLLAIDFLENGGWYDPALQVTQAVAIYNHTPSSRGTPAPFEAWTGMKTMFPADGWLGLQRTGDMPLPDKIRATTSAAIKEIEKMRDERSLEGKATAGPPRRPVLGEQVY